VMIFGGGLQIPGVLMLAPPLYLTAIWFLDAASLFRNQQPPAHYPARPFYLHCLLFCTAVVLFWIAWAIYTLPLEQRH